MANAAESWTIWKLNMRAASGFGKLESVISITAVSKEEQGKKPDCNVWQLWTCDSDLWLQEHSWLTAPCTAPVNSSLDLCSDQAFCLHPLASDWTPEWCYCRSIPVRDRISLIDNFSLGICHEPHQNSLRTELPSEVLPNSPSFPFSFLI